MLRLLLAACLTASASSAANLRPASVLLRTPRSSLKPAVNFTGTWRLVRQENFENFLRSAGVSWPLRRLATADRPSMTIKHDDAQFVWVHTHRDLETRSPG